MVNNLPDNAGDAGDMGSVPGMGRSPEGGHCNPFSILAWRIHGQRSLAGYTVHRVAFIGLQSVGHDERTAPA